MCDFFTDTNWINLGWIIAAFLALLPYIIIYKLKPNLFIKSICVTDNIIKVKVLNMGYFDAVNLRIEVCAYDQNQKYTFHFKIDTNEFLILSSGKKGKDNSKIFKINDISESAAFHIPGQTNKDKFNCLIERINNNTYKVRVRIHAYHSFSGLGKAFEEFN